jgi:hypothetical protein
MPFCWGGWVKSKNAAARRHGVSRFAAKNGYQ